MDALLETLLGIAGAIALTTTGATFKLYGALQRSLADAAGWKQSFDREHEATERYRRAEDLAQATTVATKAALAAMGKMPPGATR